MVELLSKFNLLFIFLYIACFFCSRLVYQVESRIKIKKTVFWISILMAVSLFVYLNSLIHLTPPTGVAVILYRWLLYSHIPLVFCFPVIMSYNILTKKENVIINSIWGYISISGVLIYGFRIL